MVLTPELPLSRSDWSVEAGTTGSGRVALANFEPVMHISAKCWLTGFKLRGEPASLSSFFCFKLCTGYRHRWPSGLSGCELSCASFCSHNCNCLLNLTKKNQMSWLEILKMLSFRQLDSGRIGLRGVCSCLLIDSAVGWRLMDGFHGL